MYFGIMSLPSQLPSTKRISDPYLQVEPLLEGIVVGILLVLLK